MKEEIKKLKEEAIERIKELRLQREALMKENSETHEMANLMRSMVTDKDAIAELDQKISLYQAEFERQLQNLTLMIEAGELLCGDTTSENVLGAMKKLQQHSQNNRTENILELRSITKSKLN